MPSRHRSGYKVPEVWTVVDAVPVNAMGKVARAGLADLVERNRVPHGS